jgi:hypothetical protein
VSGYWEVQAGTHLLWGAVSLLLCCSERDVTRLYGKWNNDANAGFVVNVDAGNDASHASPGTVTTPSEMMDVAERYFEAMATSHAELALDPATTSSTALCSACLFSETCGALLGACGATRPCVERNCFCASCVDADRAALPGGGAQACVALCWPLDMPDCAGAWADYMTCKVDQCTMACTL